MKQIINYKKNYKERNDIINEIIQEKDNEYVKNISNKNSDISCDGKLYIHKNIESEILIEFCLSPAFPDGGCSLFYSSGNQELIKNNIISIDSIKKMDDNWYIVNFK